MQIDSKAALEACQKIEDAIQDLHPDTRDGGWDWCYTEPHTDTEHLENMADTLRKTREYFGGDERTKMWFVSTNTSHLVLAQCGNSPTAEARSRYISWASPTNLQLIINRLRELERKNAE